MARICFFMPALVGGGAERVTVDLCRALAAGIRPFLGLRGDVPDLLAAADCLALSSVFEGTPNVVLEALAMGTPVVATDVGACRELVTDEVGEVVPVGDAPGPRRGGVASRPTAAARGGQVERFTWEVVAAQWADVVHKANPALATARPPSFDRAVTPIVTTSWPGSTPTARHRRCAGLLLRLREHRRDALLDERSAAAPTAEDRPHPSAGCQP